MKVWRQAGVSIQAGWSLKVHGSPRKQGPLGLRLDDRDVGSSNPLHVRRSDGDPIRRQSRSPKERRISSVTISIPHRRELIYLHRGACDDALLRRRSGGGGSSSRSASPICLVQRRLVFFRQSHIGKALHDFCSTRVQALVLGRARGQRRGARSDSDARTSVNLARARALLSRLLTILRSLPRHCLAGTGFHITLCARARARTRVRRRARYSHDDRTSSDRLCDPSSSFSILVVVVVASMSATAVVAVADEPDCQLE